MNITAKFDADLDSVKKQCKKITHKRLKAENFCT